MAIEPIFYLELEKEVWGTMSMEHSFNMYLRKAIILGPNFSYCHMKFRFMYNSGSYRLI